MDIFIDAPLPWRAEPSGSTSYWNVCDKHGIMLAYCPLKDTAELIVRASEALDMIMKANCDDFKKP